MHKYRSNILRKQVVRKPLLPRGHGSDRGELQVLVRRSSNRRGWLASPQVLLRTDHFVFRKKNFHLIIAGIILVVVVFASRVWVSQPMLEPFVTSSFVASPFVASSLPQEEILIFPPKIVSTGTLQHVVKRNETIPSILRQHGLDESYATPIDKALRDLKEREQVDTALKAGQELVLKLNGKGELEALTRHAGSGKKLAVKKVREKQFFAALKTPPQVSRERVLLGEVKTSFAQAADEAGLSYEVVDDFVDLFSDRVNFRQDFRVGDRFTIIYLEENSTDFHSSQKGVILAAALRVNGRHLAAIRYVGTDGKERYFNERGELLGSSFLRFPVKFSRISSYFSTSRFHPVLKRKRPHHGVDFAAPTGTPVRTVGDGEVVFAGRSGGSGIMVKIRHNDRYMTAYLHLSKIASGIRKGTRVGRGQVIGAVGATGLATGPHLHYSLYDRGKYKDPLQTALPNLGTLDQGTRVGEGYLRRVLYTLNRYQVLDITKFFQA